MFSLEKNLKSLVRIVVGGAFASAAFLAFAASAITILYS